MLYVICFALVWKNSIAKYWNLNKNQSKSIKPSFMYVRCGHDCAATVKGTHCIPAAPMQVNVYSYRDSLDPFKVILLATHLAKWHLSCFADNPAFPVQYILGHR